ncbi:hypothetical protein EZJ49_09390 [Bdellovibrio bacteriovorus]|uniref:type II toxin-antitoxin system RelE/ParE family toxin n=1 Tax=Bdellovibrio bacteriovorus TaxID=959 RepID=UPI0021D071F4|nr:hypothetical protein EZJ49_09390 [Bdellovibrio bacteriovorus]
MTATYYRTASGREPARAEFGHLGDHRSLGNGLYELRVHFGPGYRVYFSIEGKEILLLLVAGDKSSQTRDIQMAKKYLQLHRVESDHG